MMKKLFYLMRHGQTYANAKLAVEPEREFLLTDVGIQQAQAAGAYLKTIDFDHYYTSMLQRTKDTLKYALGDDLFYESLEGLNEMELGTGETRTDVCERMKRVCTELMEKCDHQTVLAVSHAGASYCFLRNWTSKEELKHHRQAGISNAIIFKYEYENQQFQLVEVIRPELNSSIPCEVSTSH